MGNVEAPGQMGLEAASAFSFLLCLVKLVLLRDHVLVKKNIIVLNNFPGL